jgi:integral membrane protein
MVIDLFRKFETNRLFSTDEGWMLFRVAAIGEACGWTLLIIGLAIERYILPGNKIPVLIAGRIHGMLFLLYALAAIGLYPALHWSRWRAVLALAASVPPYGSLVFERWASFLRSSSEFRAFRCCLLLAMVSE